MEQDAILEKLSEKIDARDQSPLVDIKAYIPDNDSDVRVPGWV